MVQTKYFCDMCKEEFPAYSNLEQIMMHTKSGAKLRYEVCNECRNRIKAYIYRFSSHCEKKELNERMILSN